MMSGTTTTLTRYFLLLVFWAVVPMMSVGQCVSNTSTGTCSGGNGQLINNASVNPGMTFWWASGTSSRTNVNMNGGTLVVCGGTLTISSGSFNNGTIIVMGGTLNIDYALNMSNTATIINYSTLNFNNSLTLSGVPARIYNNTGGTMNVTGALITNNSSSIINSSTVNALSTFTINNSSGPALCQNLNAEFNVTGDFTNALNNGISSPSGHSCIYFAGNITLNLVGSNTADLNVCDDASGTTGGPSNWGAATVFSSCVACATNLPVELLNFEAKEQATGAVALNWATSSEINNEYFTVERSRDGNHWEPILNTPGAGNSQQTLYYTAWDENPMQGMCYYRLKQTDFDGAFEYSHVVAVKINSGEHGTVQAYPNPTTAVLNVVGDELELTDVVVLDIVGKNVTNQVNFIHRGTLMELDLTALPSGTFFIRTENTVNRVYKL